jgi:hypothetical protein
MNMPCERSEVDNQYKPIGRQEEAGGQQELLGEVSNKTGYSTCMNSIQSRNTQEFEIKFFR